MKRISLKVNLLKLDKTRFEDREYQNKAGETVKEKNLLLDLVVVDEPRTVTSGDTWELQNIGFVTETATKEERARKENRPIIGSATTFKDKVAQPNFNKDSQGKEVVAPQDDIEIPW